MLFVFLSIVFTQRVVELDKNYPVLDQAIDVLLHPECADVWVFCGKFLVSRKIINNFKAVFNGITVFETRLEPAVSPNPFIQFTVKMQESGEFTFTWTDDDGSVYETKKKITVS